MANYEIENKRKATEIAQSVSFFWTNEDDAEKSIVDTISLQKAIFNASLQAMEWKDEQHAQEKQQWIDKACEWLKKNMIGLDMGKYPMYSPNFINDFRKVMEE